MGRATVLFVSRSALLILDHGVPAGRGPNDDVDEI